MFRRAGRRARPERGQARGQAGHTRLLHLLGAPRRRARAGRARPGRGGAGVQVRHQHPQRRAHRHRRADGRPCAGGARPHAAIRARAAPVRLAHRRLPGRAAHPGAGGDRGARGAARGVQRSAHEGGGHARGAGGSHGQAPRLAGGRARREQVHRAAGRRGLHQGLRRREVLPRRQDRRHLRGHVQHPAADDRQAYVGQVQGVERAEPGGGGLKTR
mmetsp:Transcript_58222/g.139733  ORF Transcript_58222/g.139733 Transcript_58222/m.139733 type:complete len:216 (+) Transcript_58222:700-1347(+)